MWLKVLLLMCLYGFCCCMCVVVFFDMYVSLFACVFLCVLCICIFT